MLRRSLSNQFVHCHFQFGKSHSSFCSWKCTAIAFIFAAILLLTALAFCLILIPPPWNQDSNYVCPLAEDEVEGLPESNMRVESSTLRPGTSVTSYREDGLTTEIFLGGKYTTIITSYNHWILQYHPQSSLLARFNFSLGSGSRLGVFGRQNNLPTHTRYNFLEILTTDGSRDTRNEKEKHSLDFVQYLERGAWFISVFNDGDRDISVTLTLQSTDETSLSCPYDCHGHGRCSRGRCLCEPDYTGDSCSHRICPVLCNNRGEYVSGECVCSIGWKGKECELREYECEKLDCSGHGECHDGACKCFPGYKGTHCENIDCIDPKCSDRGVCVNGRCVCRKGWKGDDCGHPDSNALRCLPDCSGHGQFDLATQRCLCDDGWTGADCSQVKCDIDCGQFGRCEGGSCVCSAGWSGNKCSIKVCDLRCKDHGQCKNGSCFCIQGWNGKHCTLEGCPKSCSNRGECALNEEEDWACFCENDWDGVDCSVPLERKCSDGIDNDKDGLVDCADSECCSTNRCEDHSFCQSAADPLDILLRKQPPAITASFFERMQFLIEEESIRTGTDKKIALNGSTSWNRYKKMRTSIIRGQVFTALGSPVIGVRVGVAERTSSVDFTLTQDTGWFDILVNGGGSVKLNFQREPFLPKSVTVPVPWNEIVVINKVSLQLDKRKPVSEHSLKSIVCWKHDYDIMKPVVSATWKHSFQGGCPEKRTVLAESQVIQETMVIPDTNIHLVYHSSRASGYLSTIQLQLTPDAIPKDLKLVLLKISIEGILFEKKFEADPAIKFTYAWNRRNVYRQKVYGVATATVYVGYEYYSCSKVIWEVHTTQISGHDMSVSDIGGWNLDIHHKYNFHEGILQKGDGNNVYLKNKPKLLRTTVGDGQQRPLQCDRCSGGRGKAQRLLAPVSLASGPDGSVYVGDFNLVRKIAYDGTMTTIVELSPSQVSYSYHIAIGPVDGILYISDPEQHLILRTLSMSGLPNSRNNTEPVVGNGEKCLPRDKDNCGDGRPARKARLSYPKGIALSSDGEIFIADGTNIRMVDARGYMHTLIGDYFHKSWRPIPCSETLSLSQVNLRWPTELSINPLDGSLHILDDHLVLRVTPDNRLKVVAGRSLQCPSQSKADQTDYATDVFLESPQSIAFAPNGDLYVAESDSQTVNRVRVVNSDGRIARIVGAESKCSCLDATCTCFDEGHVLALTSKLSTISSITISPDGRLHICDQGNLRIRALTFSLPQLNEMNEYDIYSPETQEIYVFNRHGQHISTKNSISGKEIYTFSYNVNTSFGKLSTVTDAAGNKIYVLRDYSNQVNTIENTQGGKCRLEMSRMRMLQSFTTPSSFKTSLEYHSSTGLLRSTRDSTGKSYVYNYDGYGRLTEIIKPSGKDVQLAYSLSVKGASVTATTDGRNPISFLIKGSDVTTNIGSVEERITQHPDGSLTVDLRDSTKLDVETMPNPVLSNSNSGTRDVFQVPSRIKVSLNENDSHYFEWHYFVHADGNARDKRITRIGRKLKRNGNHMFSVVFDRERNAETIYDRHQVPLVTATYDTNARQVALESPQNIAPVKVEFDQFGRLVNWRRGTLQKHYNFDTQGRLMEIKNSNENGIMFRYDEKVIDFPTELILPSGSRYVLQYDTAGGLHAVITPNGNKHEFGMQTSLGFYKFLYLSPGIKYPYVIHYDESGNRLAKIYPENLGRVVYAYDSSERLKTIFCGSERTEFSYLDRMTLVHTWTKITPDVELHCENRYQGSLLLEENLEFSDTAIFNNIRCKYRHEGQSTTVIIEIADKIKTESKIRYNEQFGTIEQIDQFLVHRPKVNNIFIQDDQRQFSKTIERNAYGLVSLIAITIWNNEVYSLTIVYDGTGKINQTQMKIGEKSSKSEITNYSYTPDGFIGEVIGSSQTCRYLYDINGNLNSIWNRQDRIPVRFDDGDRPASCNEDISYTIDGRGFIISRGKEKFLFNAKSQLVHALLPEAYDVKYYYDADERLVAWKEGRRNITQFLYTDKRHPNRVTHVHLPSSRITYSFSYDINGHLMYVRDSRSNRYFVACDHLGSPIALFDSDGSLLKRINRSPFGALVTDSNPALALFVDYRGGIRDEYTKMIFIKGQVYEPQCAHWLTPRWENVLDFQGLPRNIHLYRFSNNDPINPAEQEQIFMMGLPSWLQSFGYELSGLNSALERIKSPGQQNAFPESLPVISGLSCSADVILRQFAKLSNSPFPLSSSENPIQLRIANLPPVLGEGILLSTSQRRAVVFALKDASPILTDVITEVLNDTEFIDVHFSTHGQDSFHFVQSDQKKVQEDWNQLQRLGTLFNVTMHAGDSHVDLRLQSSVLYLNIRYGGTALDEKGRLIRHARRRAVEEAWKRETDIVRSGFPGSRQWESSEVKELLDKGVVSNFFGTSVHDTDLNPQLSDDPTAITFKKLGSGTDYTDV